MRDCCGVSINPICEKMRSLRNTVVEQVEDQVQDLVTDSFGDVV